MRHLALFLLCAWSMSLAQSPMFNHAEQERMGGVQAHVPLEMGRALADPYHHYRSGGTAELVRMLGEARRALPKVISTDSLNGLLQYATDHRNHILTLTCHLISLAQTRALRPERSCASAAAAAEVAFARLGNHRLASSIAALAPEECAAARAIGQKIATHVEHDLAVDHLLKIPWHGMTRSEKNAHAQRLTDTLRAHSESTLLPKGYKRVGEIYYKLQMYRPMKRAYMHVLAADSTLRRSTPIGYHLEMGSKALRRKSILTLAIAGLALALAALLIRAFRAGFILNGAQLLRRIGIYAAIYVALAIVVFTLDLFMSARPLAEATHDHPVAVSIQTPLVPISFTDTTNAPLALTVLLLGFIPVAVALLYANLGRSPSRLAAAGVSLLTALACWTLFLVLTTTDNFLRLRVVRTNGHFYYMGELEDVLVDDPQKALRANPGLLSTDNHDLELFLEEHYPDGLVPETKE